MKGFVIEVLTQFQKGQITLQGAANRLITEKAQGRKAKSNRRLKSLCAALQPQHNPAKAQQLKNRLSHEFYHGDQVQ